MKNSQYKCYFNEFFQDYQLGRLGYFDEIYQNISNICGFDNNSNILEIGAGSGNATDDILKKWSPNMTLIEPGSNFVSLLKKKYRNNNKITVINTTYEDYCTDNKYDGIISATAFHWINKEMKYRKSYNLLRNSGFLILFWNNYSVSDEEINEKIIDIYDFYGEKFECNYLRQKKKIDDCRKELESNTNFIIVEHKEIEKVVKLDSYEFIKLLNTFIGHNFIEKKINDEIVGLLSTMDGSIPIRILTNLEIAKKRNV